MLLRDLSMDMVDVGIDLAMRVVLILVVGRADM